jgi:hypothetical protein
VTNGIALNSQASTISQYYDPQVEFLELGVTVAGKTTWKLYGPDLNGAYGGLNGTGGLDAIVPGDAQFLPTLSDARGNIHAFYNVGTGATTWNASRPTGYGSVPGYAPAPLGFGGSLVQASAWRGRWVDITGCINLGAPIGRILAPSSRLTSNGMAAIPMATHSAAVIPLMDLMRMGGLERQSPTPQMGKWPRLRIRLLTVLLVLFKSLTTAWATL